MKTPLSREDVFELISQSSIYGNLGLFVGAGLSMAVMNGGKERIALSWGELIQKCSEELEVPLTTKEKENLSFPEQASIMIRKHSKKNQCTFSKSSEIVKKWISDFTSWYPDEAKRVEYGQYLEVIDPKWIITTNYDLIIEGLLIGRYQLIGPNEHLCAPKHLIPVFHLHGVRTDPSSIIIDQSDYISLFRPNDYRLQKLPLTIKESTTLIIGYSLGDINVLTAVDWSKNVYSSQPNYPHDIIQFLFKRTKLKKHPYRDDNNILIVEFDDLSQLLEELCDYLRKANKKAKRKMETLSKYNEALKKPLRKSVKAFVDDNHFRSEIIDMLKDIDGLLLTSGFLQLFDCAMDEIWERAKPNGAFKAYDQGLSLVLDMLINIPIQDMPPSLVESLMTNLNKLSRFIGSTGGQSFGALRTWRREGKKISGITISEMRNICASKRYRQITDLIELLE